jgi:hypothetical protein
MLTTATQPLAFAVTCLILATFFTGSYVIGFIVGIAGAFAGATLFKETRRPLSMGPEL